MATVDFRRAIDEIRERTSLGEVAAKYVQLRRAGRHLVGLCPFHEDKTPSLHVDDEKGLYHCFACGAGGDVFKFLMEIENMSFIEVARELSEATGVPLPRGQAPAAGQDQRGALERLRAVNREAARFYHGLLKDDPACHHAREYLRQRQVDDAAMRRFGLGCAPPEAWESLVGHLKAKGYPASLVEQAGLAVPGKQGGHYDRFRNLLLFPILMKEGMVLGFSGRTLSGDPKEAKYINTPETPLYRKSEVIFGYHLAREAIRKSGRVIMVEGNFDVLRMHLHGFENTVAPCGTALAEPQLAYLKRLGATLVLAFDGDEAGRKAAFRVAPLVMEKLIETKVVFLPQGKDPDDFLREGGAAPMEDLLSRSRDLFSAWVEHLAAQAAGSPERLSAVVHQVAEAIARVSDGPARSIYQPKAAYLCGVPEATMQREVAHHLRALRPGAARRPAREEERPVESDAVPEPEPLEVQLLAILLSHGDLLHDPAIALRLRDLELSAPVKSLVDQGLNQGGDVLADMLAQGQGSLVQAVRRRLMDMDPGEKTEALASTHRVVDLLEAGAIERQLGSISIKMRQEQDPAARRELLARNRSLLKRKQLLRP